MHSPLVSSSSVPIPQQDLDRLKAACKTARQLVLDSGRSIIESQNGWLVEVFPDGTVVQLKELPAKRRVSINGPPQQS